MSKTGTFLSIADDQEGKSPEIITRDNRLPVDSYGADIARGVITGAQPFGSYGERVATGAETNRVVWPNGVFTLPPAVGVQMSIVSTSADDDKDAGTGIRTIEFHYLDANLDTQSETIQLEGLTPVLTAATNIRFIQCMHISTYGDTAAAAGIITASNGGATYSQINASDLRCSSSMRMVPRGKRCFINGLAAGATSGTAAAGVTIRIVASELDNHQYIDPLILIPFASISFQDSSETLNLSVPLVFNEGVVIGFTDTTDKSATISASWFGWLEDA